MADDPVERLKQLETENRRLVAMIDALDDHVILLDPDSRVLFLNRATDEVTRGNYGRSRSEAIGRSALDGSQSPEFKLHIRDLLERASKGESIAEEFLLPMPDGAIWHEHHVHPVHGPGGDVEAIAIASRDIQARKQAEGRLQLLSKIGLLAGTTELDRLLPRAAELAIPELADWSILELFGDGKLHCVTVAHPDRSRAAEAERQLMATPCQVRPDELDLGARIVHIGSDDEPLRARNPALWSIVKELGATTAIAVPFVVMGVPVAIATFVFGPESGRRHGIADLPIAEEVARRAAQILENARLQAELAQALAYRERVMGILGHDLRNPVSAVLSLSTTLAQRTDVPERSRQGLHHIHAAAERMEQMIATLLDFTQLRFRGMPALVLTSFDLDQLARTIVEELRAAHPGREVALHAPEVLRGRWDSGRLGQLISNLVVNALTHGAPGSPVTVSLATEDRRVVIAVTNRGPTISSDALGKLYEPFWQAPKEGAAKARGLGLGLFIVQQVVQAHGGEIAARSADEQTTFTVRLPR